MMMHSLQDQWMTSKGSAGKPEVQSGGMKPSASAPSSLPSTKSSHSSLFVDADDEDDDDLFTPKQEFRYSALSCPFRTDSAEIRRPLHTTCSSASCFPEVDSRAGRVQSPTYTTKSTKSGTNPASHKESIITKVTATTRWSLHISVFKAANFCSCLKQQMP